MFNFTDPLDYLDTLIETSGAFLNIPPHPSELKHLRKLIEMDRERREAEVLNKVMENGL